MRRLFIAILCLIFPSFNVFAKKAMEDKVFILHDARTPISITKAGSAREGIVMRLPDQDKELATTPGPKLRSKVISESTIPKQRGLAHDSTLSFHPLKIAGTMRTPRIHFARVALPTPMREASSSTDFVSRSLIDEP